MKKKHIIARDSEYFSDDEDVIKLEFCKNDGEACRLQMEFMNGKLLLARKFVDKKEYPRALEVINEAFHSTFDLKFEQCQKCAKLFRVTILNSLDQMVYDLQKMTKGFFGNKNYKPDLVLAEKLFEELKTK